MHFKVLVEDISGKKALDILIPKIIDINSGQNTFEVHSYRGIGQIPKNITSVVDASKRQLLNLLPGLLKGHGKTFEGYGNNYPIVLFIVVDLDNKCLADFKQELLDILNTCNPKPLTRFCFSIEEGEAWFLGDINAIQTAYPAAKNRILSNYVNDSICGTWELLADALYAGGHQALKDEGWMRAGEEKSNWAKNISPYMDVQNNKSPSFCYFRDKLQELKA